MMQLYQPEKYRVYLGNKAADFGFCSVWNEPEAIFKKSEIIRNKIAILGTLYSRYGVNVILRNLALNPQIRKLFLWGNGNLSNTQFGLAGKLILESLWQTKGGQSSLESVEEQIDRDILKKIIENVKLIDVSKYSLEETEKIIVEEIKENGSPYMEPKEFPEAKLEEFNSFPSEEVGWIARGKTVIEAWSRVVERIMRYGLIKGTQYGYQQKELIGITWVISEENPEKPDLSLAADWPEELKNITGANEKAIREYHRVFLSPDLPKGISYTYGSRLQNYPPRINQIEEIIVRQLKNSPDSRRACATTMIPSIDKDSNEPPCITQIQCLQTNGRLHLLATVRSHDIFKAGIPNAFGSRTLQKEIAQKTGFELGQLQITSQSAHIYEQDWDNAYKLAKCFYWERRPDLIFNPVLQSDPRGNILISINGDKIIASLQSAESSELMRFEGKTAKEISKKIAEFELLSRSDHLLDVGMELQKAEIALSQNIEYHQDRPLNFNLLKGRWRSGKL